MELVGFKTKIIYESYENDFAIIKILDEKTFNEYILKGNIKHLSDSKTYLFDVEKQKDIFLVKKYLEIFPKTSKGIVKLFDHYFLSPVITKKILNNNYNTVENIINSKNAIKLILNNEEQKLFVDSIDLIESYFKQLKKLFYHFIKYDLQDEKFNFIYNFLISFISNNNLDLYRSLQKNPYQFFYEAKYNFNFDIIDTVAKTFLNNNFSVIRIVYWIKYIVNKLCDNSGDTFIILNDINIFLDKKLFINNDINELDKKSLISKSLELAEKIKLLKIIDNNKILDFDIFLAEKNIYEKLILINNKEINTCYNNFKEIKKLLSENSIKFSQEQENVILNSLKSNIVLVSGGPGTGKSTIINGMINVFNNINNKNHIVLLAPTGKAANRLKESIGFKINIISTIHSFISKCTNNKISNKKEIILIIDEMSMVDVKLFSDLLTTIYTKTKISKLILLGDINQLKSIKCGNLFEDLLSSNKFKSYYLTKNFRQKNNNELILFSNEILNNNFKYIDKNYKKMKLFSLDDKDSIIKICIKEMAKNDISKTQIIAATKKYKLGSENINKCIQKYINPYEKGNSIKIGKNKYFKINDRVMQSINNTDLGISNGDFGIIKDIFYKNNDNSYIRNAIIKIQFENNLIDIPYKYIKDIELGYATTVHKMQGSESEYIIFVIDSFTNFFLQKNLIYTAITRSKNKLLILTDKLKSFNEGVNKIPPKRNTFLKHYLN